MPRNCTLDYKVERISKFVRWEVLGYKKGQRLRDEDKKAHEMHMGFSFEEKQRCKDSPNPMFVNRFPLVDMELTRADNYAYILDVWGLDTKASACCFCPFHRNYFFENLKEHQPQTYAKLLEVDELLRDKNPKPPMDSRPVHLPQPKAACGSDSRRLLRCRMLRVSRQANMERILGGNMKVKRKYKQGDRVDSVAELSGA